MEPNEGKASFNLIKVEVYIHWVYFGIKK